MINKHGSEDLTLLVVSPATCVMQYYRLNFDCPYGGLQQCIIHEPHGRKLTRSEMVLANNIRV